MSARISPLTTFSDDVAKTLTQTHFLDGAPLNVFATLAHHPRILKRFNVLAGAYLAHGIVPERVRELVIVRVCWRCNCRYELRHHAAIATQSGLSAAEVEGLAADAKGWSAEDRALIDLVDELFETDSVSDTTWAALQRRWATDEVVELLTMIGFYRMLCGFINAVGVELEPGVPELPT